MEGKKTVVLLFSFGLLSGVLLAAPDPDIFDGRFAAPAAESVPDTAASPTPAADDAAAATDAVERADSGDDQAQAESDASADASANAQTNGSQTTEESVAEAAQPRSFEGLDAIGGQPVDHPAAPELPPSERTASTAAGAGTAEASGAAGTGATEGGADSERRTFDGLDVGGRDARDQQVEVRRSIELRPAPNAGQRPPATTRPEPGGAPSPGGQRAPAEDGSDIPTGL